MMIPALFEDGNQVIPMKFGGARFGRLQRWDTEDFPYGDSDVWDGWCETCPAADFLVAEGHSRNKAADLLIEHRQMFHWDM